MNAMLETNRLVIFSFILIRCRWAYSSREPENTMPQRTSKTFTSRWVIDDSELVLKMSSNY